jgi:hypothetical protein
MNQKMAVEHCRFRNKKGMGKKKYIFLEFGAGITFQNR